MLKRLVTAVLALFLVQTTFVGDAEAKKRRAKKSYLRAGVQLVDFDNIFVENSTFKSDVSLFQEISGEWALLDEFSFLAELQIDSEDYERAKKIKAQLSMFDFYFSSYIGNVRGSVDYGTHPDNVELNISRTETYNMKHKTFDMFFVLADNLLIGGHFLEYTFPTEVKGRHQPANPTSEFDRETFISVDPAAEIKGTQLLYGVDTRINKFKDPRMHGLTMDIKWVGAFGKARVTFSDKGKENFQRDASGVATDAKSVNLFYVDLDAGLYLAYYAKMGKSKLVISAGYQMLLIRGQSDSVKIGSDPSPSTPMNQHLMSLTGVLPCRSLKIMSVAQRLFCVTNA